MKKLLNTTEIDRAAHIQAEAERGFIKAEDSLWMAGLLLRIEDRFRFRLRHVTNQIAAGKFKLKGDRT